MCCAMVSLRLNVARAILPLDLIGSERGSAKNGNKPINFAFYVLSRYFLTSMRCPFCGAEKESLKVIDSRTCDGGKAIRRRRQCLACGKRFTTYEKIEGNFRLTVIKKDGRRVPWSRDKLLTGLQRA